MTINVFPFRKFIRLLLTKGGNERELQRRRHAVAERKTDYHRWTQAKNYNPQWSSRSHVALDLLKDAKWVCDLGCGPQELRKLLPADTVYLPMDLKQWSDDTVVCDINNKLLPKEYLELSDLCFVMGVLEYVYDGPWFLNALASHAQGIVISYNVAELCKVKREDNGWVTNLTTEQFKLLVETAGFKIDDTRIYDNAQLIIRAVNRNFDRSALSQRQLRRDEFLKIKNGKAY